MQSRWRLCSTFSNDRIYTRHKGRRPFNILHTGSEKFYPSRLQVKKSKKKGRARMAEHHPGPQRNCRYRALL